MCTCMEESIIESVCRERQAQRSGDCTQAACTCACVVSDVSTKNDARGEARGRKAGNGPLYTLMSSLHLCQGGF